SFAIFLCSLLLFTPGYHDADVPRHVAGEIDNLIEEAIAAGFQVVGPELVDFARDSRQRAFPTRLLPADGAAAIGAERTGKPVDLHLAQAVSHRALDDGSGKLDLFVLRKPGRLA